MTNVENYLKNAKDFWERKDPDAIAKWFPSQKTAIFAGVCYQGECEPREGTNTAPAFLSPTEFANKNVKVDYSDCPRCGEGDWEAMPWELAALCIDKWEIYLEDYQSKLNQISEFENLDGVSFGGLTMDRLRKEGYQYWVNGTMRLAFTHPNDWKFENPDGINYINTYAGMKRPGVLFEGWDILRLLEEADTLEEAHDAVQKTINKVDKINEELLVEDS